MNAEDPRNTISQIERAYPVDSITYKERPVWPILRKYLGFELFFVKTPVPAPPPAKGSLFKAARSMVLSPLKIIKILLLKQKAQREFQKANAIHTDCWFLSAPELYVDVFGQKKYNRYIDPYYEVVKNEYSCSLFSTANPGKDYYYPVHFFDHRYFFQYHSAVNDFFNLQRISAEEKALEQHIKRVNELLEGIHVSQRIPLHAIIDIKHILIFEEFFFRLLKNNKPSFVFIECFYSTERFALVAACKRLGIKTIEIQHGTIEDFMYAPWKNTQTNYNFVPDYIWCWSQSDREQLQKYNNDAVFLKPVPAGNMWMKKFYHAELSGYDNDLKAVLKFAETRRLKKIIVFTHQWGYRLSDTLIELIRNSQSKWLWLIRLHPVSSEKEKQEIIDLLREFKNIEYEVSGKVNLYSLFQIADSHITYSSTSCIEALSFNLRTILIHRHGLDYYKNLVDKGALAYCESYEDIFHALEIDKKSFDAGGIKDYIIRTNPKEAMVVFKKAIFEDSLQAPQNAKGA